MVIFSKFRIGQHRDDDHGEDAPHFNICDIGIAAYIDPRVLLERYSGSSGIL